MTSMTRMWRQTAPGPELLRRNPEEPVWLAEHYLLVVLGVGAKD